ncbi:ATP-dependent helicase [Fastidiosibacter lacustris]|uniref:ATP-dependent helicase n=1 Tax=Fastidiosibacter lacustris TaxID=2056695 RepID=UPI000E349380|nr:ATP-dependent helicase [Fastidiosibacter lacustris]
MKGKLNYTAEQWEVIRHDLDSHALIAAVAGSGKTQTLIARIEHLLENNVNPHEILVLMFNKSACNDFQKRLSLLEFDMRQRIDIKTFHALGYKTIGFMEKKGLLEPATLINADYLLEKLTKEALQKTHRLMAYKEEITTELIDTFSQYVAMIKSNLLLSDALKLINKSEYSKVEVFFQFYEQLRYHYKWRTFDDLLYEPMQILYKNKVLAERFGNRYHYVIVDEYQDINEVQQYLLKLVAANAKSVMVMGDVDQTIYEWRGSKPYYMSKGFALDFQPLKRYSLSQTFRYGHLLSMMANQVIQYNDVRSQKICFSALTAQKKTDVNIISKKQLTSVIEAVQQDLDNQLYLLQDVVVLVRKYSSSILFELACLQVGMTYQILGGKSVFKLSITETILGYLQLTEQAKYLLILDKATCQNIICTMLSYPSLYLTANQLHSLAALLCEQPTKPEEVFSAFNKMYTLPFYQQKHIEERMFVWRTMLNWRPTDKAKTVINGLYTLLDLKSFLTKKTTVNPVYMDSDVADAWLSFASDDQKTLAQFIQQLLNLKEKSLKDSNSNSGLVISSIHKAKGLQWQHVILCDMTEQSFFGNVSEQPTQEEIERERRLFYVAITRAISKLSIIAGTDIAKLNQWFNTGGVRHPCDLRKTNSVRFLYESQLLTCEKALHTLTENHNNAVNIKPKYNKLIATYLQRLQSKASLIE